MLYTIVAYTPILKMWGNIVLGLPEGFTKLSAFHMLLSLCGVLPCFSSSCVPYVASFSGLYIFDCPFGISNTYS